MLECLSPTSPPWWEDYINKTTSVGIKALVFYVGINLGSFLASITVGIVAAVYGWHYGFGLAGIGMFVGLLVYLYGQRFLVHVGNQPTLEEKASDISLGQLFSQLLKSPLQLTIV